MDDDPACWIPYRVVASMLLMSRRISKDLASIAGPAELADSGSAAFSLNFANNVIQMALLKALSGSNDASDARPAGSSGAADGEGGNASGCFGAPEAVET